MKVSAAAVVALFAALTSAVFLDTNNYTSIQEATALIAKGTLDYYDGAKYGGTIGMFTAPYYWWEAGGAWGTLIEYSYLMQNDSLVPLIREAMEYQTGDDDNYMPLNQTTTEGNDDQGFWGIAAIGAAERNFLNPLDKSKLWLGLAQGVFNTMTSRWDDKLCGGGLRWQIFQWNSGYDYKNSVSSGCLFHISARLARFTGNDLYVDWAEKVWDWMVEVNLITQGDFWFVYDGLAVENCSDVTTLQWTYNQGLMMAGAAYLYNHTQDEKWLNRTVNLVRSLEVFFVRGSNIMYEAACQPVTVTSTSKITCNNDQRSFKAYFTRFLSLTSVMVPETAPQITLWLTSSANAAAASCSGGTDGHTCGLSWNNATWDGYFGLGEQISALEVMVQLRALDMPPPFTASDGGLSVSMPGIGYGNPLTNTKPLTLGVKDKAGAGIITAVIGSALVAMGIWLVI